MRTVIKMIIVLVALALATAGPAPAQETTEEHFRLEMLDSLLAEGYPVAASEPVSKRYVLSSSNRPADGRAVLVIPSGRMKQEDLAAIAEDMRVMSRIFDKKLRQAHMLAGGAFSGIPASVFFGHRGSVTEGIYLDGYGALFLMKVNFPLSAPPEPPEQKKPKKEADEIWTQTKQEIYTPEEIIQKTNKVPTPLQEYDAEKVENLKTTLLKALKHAANIRNLKPDDSVIVMVNGQGPAVATVRVTGEAYTSKALKTGFGPSAALTIRVKKSDVDAYSKGDLDLDEFRKKAVMFIY